MPKIVISYRRSDSSSIAGRIFDRLIAYYGEESVFMDVDNIPFGTDFRTHIDETLRQTDVLLAVIGQNWLGADPSGAVRMSEKTDPVRVEIETSLAHNLPIIPVLVEGAKMPDSTLLPPEFGNFAFLNAADVASGRDFHIQMERVIGAINRITNNVSSDVTPKLTPQIAQKASGDNGISSRVHWLSDTLRYFIVPLLLLLVAHHIIVNALDLDTRLLWFACGLVPFLFGFACLWVGRRGAGFAAAVALALGIVGTAGMTISQSLNSGDPIIPQTRLEWWDNVNFAATITLSFIAGHILARLLRAARGRRTAKL